MIFRGGQRLCGCSCCFILVSKTRNRALFVLFNLLSKLLIFFPQLNRILRLNISPHIVFYLFHIAPKEQRHL